MMTLQQYGSAARFRQFDELCDVVYARINSEPQTAIEIIASAKLRARGLADRTLYRALQRLVEEGRVVRRGGRAGAIYTRSTR